MVLRTKVLAPAATTPAATILIRAISAALAEVLPEAEAEAEAEAEEEVVAAAAMVLKALKELPEDPLKIHDVFIRENSR